MGGPPCLMDESCSGIGSVLLAAAKGCGTTAGTSQRTQARYMHVNHQHRPAPLHRCGGQHFRPSTHGFTIHASSMLWCHKQIKALQSMIEAGRTTDVAQHCKPSIFPSVSPLGYAAPSTLLPPQEEPLLWQVYIKSTWATG